MLPLILLRIIARRMAALVLGHVGAAMQGEE